MKAQLLKIAGVKSEKEFYKKYPTEEAFFKAHPEAAMMQKPKRQFGGDFIQKKQDELMGMAKQYGPMLMQLAPMFLEEGGELLTPEQIQKMQQRQLRADSIHDASNVLLDAFMKKGGSTYSGGTWYQNGGEDPELLRAAASIEKGVNAALPILDKGLAYGLKGAKWVGKNVFGTDDIVPNFVKDYIFNAIRPVSYPNDLIQVANEFIRSDKAKPTRDKSGDLRMDEEAWSHVLGRPTKNKYFVPSQYKPTSATDPNAQYYQLAPGILDEERMKRILNDNYFARNGRKNKQGKEYVPLQGMEPLLRQQFLKDYKKNAHEDFYETDPLANFQVYRDKDPKTGKPYLSISDVYNFGLESANEMIKPMNIYHRIYGKGGSTYSGGLWYKDGGIHIDPANRGKFTASAKRAGMDVQEYAAYILANKEDFSPEQVKRANFARNAAKWNHEYGGTPMMQYAGETPAADDTSWINKIFDYESKHGSKLGTGLSNFGYNSPRGFKKGADNLFRDSKGNLYNGTGQYTAPKNMGEAVSQFTKEYLPDVMGYPAGMRERAGDFLYNTGEDARLYQLDQYVRQYEKQPNGLQDRGLYRSNGSKSAEFGKLYSQYQDKINALPMQDQIRLMDQGRDYYYQNIDTVNGKPNAAYAATWKPRLGIWGNYSAQQQQPAAAPKTQVAQPAATAAPVTQTPVVQAAPVVQQPAAQTVQQTQRTPMQVQTAPSLQVKQQPVGSFPLPNLTAIPSMPAIGPAAAQAAGINTDSVINQNQNTSGLNSPFTIGANTTLGKIPQTQTQTFNTNATQNTNTQMPGTTLFNPGSFGSGVNQFSTPGALNLSTTGKNPYLNEALKGKEYNPNASGIAGADVSGMFAKTVAAGNENTGSNFNQKLGAIQNKLAEGMTGDPIIGAIGDVIEGINNRKDYNAALDKQKQNNSTDYAYNTSYSTAANKGQYDMYGTMMPNQIGGNLSYAGMNQKYNMPANMYELGGAYETSALSWIPKDLPMPTAEAPFIDASGSADMSSYDMDAARRSYGAAPAYNPAAASANLADLPLDADAMLATLGLQESSSKKGETALGLRTKLVGPGGKRGTASGTYQITKSTLKGLYDSTFKNQYGSYAQFENAFNTNPDVEYAAAKTLMNSHIKNYGIYALGAWYQPSFAARAAKGDMSVMNTIPAPEYGNKVTFGDYFNKSIANYRKALGLPVTQQPSGQIATKKNVNISSLEPNLMSFASTMSNNFPGIVISSGNDSNKHMKDSRHYENKAIDIGANSSDPKAYAQLKKFLKSNPAIKQQYGIEDIIDENNHLHIELYRNGGQMIKRADGSYSKRGLWDNIRANRGSGKKPTRDMLEQERKIRREEMEYGGEMELTEDQINYIRSMGGEVEFL